MNGYLCWVDYPPIYSIVCVFFRKGLDVHKCYGVLTHTQVRDNPSLESAKKTNTLMTFWDIYPHEFLMKPL